MWFIRFYCGDKGFDVALNLLAFHMNSRETLLAAVRAEAESHGLVPDAVEFVNIMLHFIPVEKL
jgi:hypothetical protein